MLAPNAKPQRPSVAILGAGDLVSHVHRCENDTDKTNYQFNIFRLANDMQVTHEIRACDLRDVIKLCQVLTFAILDDGWSPPSEQAELLRLNEQLDELTQRWEEPKDE